VRLYCIIASVHAFNHCMHASPGALWDKCNVHAYMETGMQISQALDAHEPPAWVWLEVSIPVVPCVLADLRLAPSPPPVPGGPSPLPTGCCTADRQGIWRRRDVAASLPARVSRVSPSAKPLPPTFAWRSGLSWSCRVKCSWLRGSILRCSSSRAKSLNLRHGIPAHE
jgi:hypothetical protein